MKVLTHEGVLLTFNFTTKPVAPDEFQRLNDAHATKHGVVAEMDERVVRHLLNGASRKPGRFLTPREILGDLQSIDRALHDIPIGTEIKAQTAGGSRRLVIPAGARAAARLKHPQRSLASDRSPARLEPERRG
jgi:hypothetical protein